MGSKYERPSGEENKNPNNLKVTVLKQVSKNLLPGKFSENRFFLSCIGIGDRYSKSLLKVTIQIVESNQGFAPLTTVYLVQERNTSSTIIIGHIGECHYVSTTA